VKATGLLDEGLQIARELGMKPLVERALRDREFLSAEVLWGKSGDFGSYRDETGATPRLQG